MSILKLKIVKKTFKNIFSNLFAYIKPITLLCSTLNDKTK